MSYGWLVVGSASIHMQFSPIRRRWAALTHTQNPHLLIPLHASTTINALLLLLSICGGVLIGNASLSIASASFTHRRHTHTHTWATLSTPKTITFVRCCCPSCCCCFLILHLLLLQPLDCCFAVRAFAFHMSLVASRRLTSEFLRYPFCHFPCNVWLLVVDGRCRR